MIRWQNWCKSGLLVAVGLVFALAIAEGLVRLVAPQPTGLSHQDRYGLAMHYPGITRYLPQYGHHVSFNSAGMRDEEHALKKEAGVFRVLLLGDSFMEALQVPFDASLPSLLEQSLAKGIGRPVEVVSAGVSGWGTDDELRYLTEYGLRYDPDLVLVAMTLHNDVSDNLRREWHTLEGDSLVTRPVRPMSSIRYSIVELKAFLATRFQLYQLWRRARHGREIRQAGSQLQSHVVQLFLQPSPSRVTEGFELTERLLAAVRDTTRASGGQIALVLLPIVYQLSDSAFATFALAGGGADQKMRLRAPQEMMTGMADGLDVPVIDLLPAFRQWTAEGREPLYLTWDGHWNEAGHRLAAEVVSLGLLHAGVVE